MAVKLDFVRDKRTVAELARELSDSGKKVNLKKIAAGRDMMVSSLEAADGSTIKLLENYDEVDVIVMKDGKVLTAKGKFVADEEAANDLASEAICRIANHAVEGKDLHVDFWA